MTLLVGLDLGNSLGIAVGYARPDCVPECATLSLPDDPGQMALLVEGRLRSFFRTGHVGAIAYEDPFLALGPKWRAQGQAHLKTHLLTQFGQKLLILKIAAEYCAKTTPIAVNSARKFIVGKGFPTEDEILLAVRRLGASPIDNHQADAAVIWFAARGKTAALHGAKTKP